jgi:hypothetical protein
MKIRGSFETEIGVTEGGYVRISQPDPMDPQHEDSVLLSADQLPKIISELQTLLADRESWDFDHTEEQQPELQGGESHPS